jgi:hypothetical protein
MRRFMSFGAGVQSTALWILIAEQREKLERDLGGVPEIAFFADTGAEPDAIYRHIEHCQRIASSDSRYIPIKVVAKAGPSLERIMLDKTGTRFVPIPAFTGGAGKKEGMLRRQCTREYKISPLQQAYRKALGYKKGQRILPGACESWIGISTDEAGRAKQSPEKWVIKRYPLIELGLSRTDCAVLLEKKGIKPVKSRCCFCPYISDWQGFKREHPEAFERAIAVDESIRDSSKAGCTAPIYIHRSCRPLAELKKVDQLSLFEAWEDQWFEEECDGICGV